MTTTNALGLPGAPTLGDFHSILSATNRAELEVVLSQTVRSMGFDHFRFTRWVPDPGSPSGFAYATLSSYPAAWTHKYQREQFHRHDPALRHCKTSWHPLPWTNALFSPPNTRPIYEEARSHGISAGCAIPIVAGHCGFSFVRDQDADAALPDVLRALPFMKVLTGFLMEALATLVDDQPPSPQPAPANTLTRREITCIQLMGAGLRDFEIGQRLHITERTVMFHLTNARQKMNAINRSQLMARAVALGLL